MYDYLIFDTVNFGYHILNDPMNIATSTAMDFGGKRVWQRFVSGMMNSMRNLSSTYLKEEGHIVLLFDNYHSRAELEKMLRPLKENQSRREVNRAYKSHRKSARIEFYNSLDILRKWAFTAPTNIHTARIPNLEADDLVLPCIQYIREENPTAKILMCTNDGDWCRYLDENTQYLPDLHGAPEGAQEYLSKFGFSPTEDRVVLHKILEGDSSDGVSMVFPEIPPADRALIVSRFPSVIDFLLGVHGDPDLKQYSTLVKDREIETKIAFQMLSAIPVSKAHFKAVFTTGRNFVPLQRKWDELFGMQSTDDSKPKFAFGGLKIPRRDPKGD